MKQIFTNGSAGTLVAGIGVSDSVVTLQPGHGGEFPSLNSAEGEYCIAKLTRIGPGFEIVKITGRNGDVLTVERGQEGTIASSWTAGSKLELFISADTLNNFVQKKDQSGHFQVDTFVPTTGQSVFTLSKEYAVGHSAIEVSVNGVDQGPSNYQELDSRTIAMDPLYKGEVVKVRYLVTQFTDYTSASSVAYWPASGIPIDLQNYIRSLEQRIAKLENS